MSKIVRAGKPALSDFGFLVVWTAKVIASSTIQPITAE